jgi:hypothetical protein
MPPNPALLQQVKKEAAEERKRLEAQEAHARQAEESDAHTPVFPEEGYRSGGRYKLRRYGKTKRRYGKTKRRYGKTKRTRRTR